MITRSIKGKLLVFSVFFLGIASGVLLTYTWETRVLSGDVKPADRAKADVKNFYDYLGLSEEQRLHAKQISEDLRPAISKIREQIRPQMDEMDALYKQNRSQFRSILTDEQKKKYDEFNEARRNKQKAQHKN